MEDVTVSFESLSLRGRPGSPLLHLPGELRNDIFAYVFDCATISTRPNGKHQLTKSGKGALHSCRQIYEETAHLKNSYTSLTIPSDQPLSLDGLFQVVPESKCATLVTLTLTLSAAILIWDGCMRLRLENKDWQDAQLVAETFARLRHVVIVVNNPKLKKATRKLALVPAMRRLFSKEDLVVSFTQMSVQPTAVGDPNLVELEPSQVNLPSAAMDSDIEMVDV
ncbi:hypothetical protein C7974DRAFT_422354 [Boeremia exigua]|uniref:uncharacterized protein n=1 Tax=Boeremia exigua TaxID=749465 RepID=UPI001E8D6145|nr:uncharacterized protein C7974DRAFT_422354 [Boeremia exigua]KAH6639847.1 hypothetical protein C7974DRAFT_422354 [Boeremia exigua]